MELPQPRAKLDLPRIDQVGYVVRDLAATVGRYEPLFGPFTRLDTPLTGVWYRGVGCGPSEALHSGQLVRRRKVRVAERHGDGFVP